MSRVSDAIPNPSRRSGLNSPPASVTFSRFSASRSDAAKNQEGSANNINVFRVPCTSTQSSVASKVGKSSMISFQSQTHLGDLPLLQHFRVMDVWAKNVSAPWVTGVWCEKCSRGHAMMFTQPEPQRLFVCWLGAVQHKGVHVCFCSTLFRGTETEMMSHPV